MADGTKTIRDGVAVYSLDPGEEVGCYWCIQAGEHRSYGRGEAFLAEAGHSPHNGEANYICRDHLESDAVIVDLEPRGRAGE